MTANDDFFLTIYSKDLNFKSHYQGTYYLPSEINLDETWEIALDGFFSSNNFINEMFISINCDLFPVQLINDKSFNSCYLLYNKNVNEQIYQNKYYRLQKYNINTINISLQNLKTENILFDESIDNCYFIFHFRKSK